MLIGTDVFVGIKQWHDVNKIIIQRELRDSAVQQAVRQRQLIYNYLSLTFDNIYPLYLHLQMLNIYRFNTVPLKSLFSLKSYNNSTI